MCSLIVQLKLCLSTFITAIFSIIVGVLLVGAIVMDTSCAEDEPNMPAVGTITFTYTIPGRTFKYLEIEACWNNNEMTDMVHRPMLDTVFTVTYDVWKYPATFPVVFMLKRTNRSIPNQLTDIVFDMEIKTDLRIGDRIIDEVYTNKYYIDDTHPRDAIEQYMKDQRNSTYAVKVHKDATVEYIAPKQRPIIIQ